MIHPLHIRPLRRGLYAFADTNWYWRPMSTQTAISEASMRRLRIRRARHEDRARREQDRVAEPPPLRVALVGVPNTGKSTLFNRLTRQKRRRAAHAIVNPVPGTTRDYREGSAYIGDLHVDLIDTGGLEVPMTKQHRKHHEDHHGKGGAEEYGSPAGIQTSMLGLTESLLHNVDVILFMLDGRRGISTIDEHFARWVRRIQGKDKRLQNVRPVVNKMEGCSNDAPWTHQLIAETSRLGFGDPVFISAEHGDGIADLFHVLHELSDDLAPIRSQDKDRISAATALKEGELALTDAHDQMLRDERAPDPSDSTIQICIVGRPNTGKSTLTNALVGENRVLTGPTPGVTRDAIRLNMDFDIAQCITQHQFSKPTSGIPRQLRIIDTAGVRRPGKRDHSSNIESESVAESMHALKFSHVAVVVLDAQMPPTRMDLTLIGSALDEGRALVLVANKIDMVESEIDPAEICAGILAKVTDAIPQARGATVVPMSALHEKGIEKLFPTCIDAYCRWDQRITTAVLNQFMTAIQGLTPPPRGTTIRYISQVQHRPPKFMLFSSGCKNIPEHYQRFLANAIRDEFDLGGVPIRISVKAKDARHAPKNRRKIQGGSSIKLGGKRGRRRK